MSANTTINASELDESIRPFMPLIRRVARAMGKGRDWLIDDFVSDASLAVWTKAKNGTQLSEALVRRITKNKCNSRIRTERSRNKAAFRDTAKAGHRGCDGLADLVARPRTDHLPLEAAELLAGLSPDDRDVIVRRVVEDESFTDLAGERGVSKDAVYRGYHRALGSLRAQFRETLGDANDDVPPP